MIGAVSDSKAEVWLAAEAGWVIWAVVWALLNDSNEIVNAGLLRDNSVSFEVQDQWLHAELTPHWLSELKVVFWAAARAAPAATMATVFIVMA